MTDAKIGSGSGKGGRRGVRATAEARRMELERFDAAHRRREEDRRRKREELLRIVKEAEGRAKRQATNARLANTQRLKFILGGLAVAQLRASGLAGLCLTAGELKQLPDKDRRLLDEFLAAPRGGDAEDSRKMDAGASSAPGIDIEV